MRQSTSLAMTIVPVTIPATRSQRCQISMRALFDGQAGDPQRRPGTQSAPRWHRRVADRAIRSRRAAGGTFFPTQGWGCWLGCLERQRPSARETLLQPVPELDRVFAEAPAEQHVFAAAPRREVDQPVVEVLHERAELVDPGNTSCDL